MQVYAKKAVKLATLNFVGDISLNGKYANLLQKKGPRFPFQLVQGYLNRADFTVGNLESPFVPNSLAPTFKMKTPLSADPSYVDAFRWAGFDAFNLSNNHILDYGEEGVSSTMDALDQEGILHFGYGPDLSSAKKMKVVTVNGLKVGFVGYTDLVIDSPFYASEDTRGIAKFELPTAIYETAMNKSLVDILVICLHWGVEYFHLPTPDQMENARHLIDAGADIVIGHHPHTLQGIERYKAGLIAYSLGNFVFSDIRWDWVTDGGEKRTTYYKFSSRCRKGVILTVVIDEARRLSYEIQPTYISKLGQILLGPRGGSKKIEYLSRILRRNDYEVFFQNELDIFRKRTLIKGFLGRLKRVYKLRPKHFIELKDLLCRKGLLK